MSDNLKCFISAPHETDTSPIKNALALSGVESYDLYDFSIGDSIQQILKRKLRQADFALFVLAKDNHNVLYEMGVCEGLGKQYFVFIEKGYKIPFYISNRIFINDKLDDFAFLNVSIGVILQDIKKNKKGSVREFNKNVNPLEKYNSSIRNQLTNCYNDAIILRDSAHPRDAEQLLSRVFSIIGLNFVENSESPDKGIDFVLWNDNLAKIISSQILVEVKYGNITNSIVRKGIEQIKAYASQSDVGVGIFLYFDKTGKRFEVENSLKPLIINYDLEDFIRSLIDNPIERIILEQRNLIAHKAA